MRSTRVQDDSDLDTAKRQTSTICSRILSKLIPFRLRKGEDGLVSLILGEINHLELSASEASDQPSTHQLAFVRFCADHQSFDILLAIFKVFRLQRVEHKIQLEIVIVSRHGRCKQHEQFSTCSATTVGSALQLNQKSRAHEIVTNRSLSERTTTDTTVDINRPMISRY